jgi:hypothetical protein
VTAGQYVKLKRVRHQPPLILSIAHYFIFLSLYHFTASSLQSFDLTHLSPQMTSQNSRIIAFTEETERVFRSIAPIKPIILDNPVSRWINILPIATGCFIRM